MNDESDFSSFISEHCSALIHELNMWKNHHRCIILFAQHADIKKKKNSTYLNVEISLRSDQLVGWQNSQWEENLVGLQTQGFVSNIEAVTPIKQISVLPLLSLQIASLFCLSLPPCLDLSLPCLFMCFIYLCVFAHCIISPMTFPSFLSSTSCSVIWSESKLKSKDLCISLTTNIKTPFQDRCFFVQRATISCFCSTVMINATFRHQ